MQFKLSPIPAYVLTDFNKEKIMTENTYDPSRLLDELISRLELRSDAELARLLQVQPCTISLIRHHKLPVGASMLIYMHELTDISIRDLRSIMGDRRVKYRMKHSTGNAGVLKRAA